jgi:Uma2 family endonuclease
MVTIPLPDAQLMTFAKFLAWKPDNSSYELHNGTPVEMQPTGDHEEVISFLNSALVLEVHRLQQPFILPKQALIKLPDEDTAYLPDIVLIIWAWEDGATSATPSARPSRYISLWRMNTKSASFAEMR